MTRPAVGVVVVAHNTRDDVLACLASIPADLHATTVVVDNASSDATATAVRARFPSVQVLELANAGFGRGANAGVRVLDTEYVMVANADVRFGEGVFSRLAAELRDRADAGAVGPMVRSPDGVPQASARRIPTIGQIAGHALLGRLKPGNKWSAGYRGDDLDPSAVRDAEWLSGCAIMLRRDAFDAVQGFDPGYFLYAEDVDLGVRLRSAGWRLRYVPDVDICHLQGASTSRRPLRAMIEHAKSLDRYHRRHRRSLAGRVASPFVRVGLVVWVAIGWVGRLRRRMVMIRAARATSAKSAR